jgi:hypothetical protein
MTLRTDILKRIQKREEANNELHFQVNDIFGSIAANSAVIQELQAILKTLPPDEAGDEAQPETVLRKDSDVAKARDVLRTVRKPMHVDNLLAQLGKDVTKKNKASLAGQIAIYVRKGQIFTKTEPNTFGLKEWVVNGGPKSADVPLLSPDDDDYPALVLDDTDSEAIPLKPEDVREPAH